MQHQYNRLKYTFPAAHPSQKKHNCLYATELKALSSGRDYSQSYHNRDFLGEDE
jgi:hypothetical protein